MCTYTAAYCVLCIGKYLINQLYLNFIKLRVYFFKKRKKKKMVKENVSF